MIKDAVEEHIRMNIYEAVKAFHEKFEVGYDGPPRALESKEMIFRLTAMNEELVEYMVAVQKDDLEGQFDALIDLIYFAMGTAYLQGFDFNEGMSRVQEANMAKVLAGSAEDSKRGFKRDVVKPEGWTAPDLGDLV